MKYSCLPDSVNRVRRIVGRVINSKRLPAFVYRLDTRAPAFVRATGFQPWNAAGNITLMEHVNNAYAPGHAQQGQLTRQASQYVSTGGYGLLKPLDATFANQLHETNLYKIDTAVAQQTGLFFDVNDIFDKAGVDRPYATQREWLKLGGIDQSAVIEMMTGATFAGQMVEGVAPDEDNLQDWVAF